MGSKPHFSTSKLEKTFAHNDSTVIALEIEPLSIRRGEFFCILGPSGCGKSTLLNILAGFEKPTQGEVHFDDCLVTGPNPKSVMVFQDCGLYPWRNTRENVTFGLELQGKSPSEYNQVADHYLELVGLSDFSEAYPQMLSGGMKQRVAIARALSVQPEALLMDEPFGALDALTRVKMQDELRTIWEKTKKTIIFVTHSIDEAVFLGDRVAVLSERPGRVKRVFDITIERPRHKLDERLLKIKREIFEELGISD